MKHEELVVQVMLKPNCGLENTRASLVVRRVTPLCDSVSCHPRTVKSDRATVTYLRDHGLFIRFRSPTPEQVLLAIKGSFFVDRCIIVENTGSIPAYEEEGVENEGDGCSALPLPSSFADAGVLGEHGEELTDLLARFEEVHRELRAHAEATPRDRTLNSIVFSHAQVVDGLRTAVARSRIEPFSRIAPSLRALVADYSHRFGVLADLDIVDGNMALDHSVLATMEEIIKRIIRLCLRDGIEQPEQRAAAGKPPRATMRLRLESDGSEAVCRIEHDGRLFNPHLVGQQAVERGLLARPLETYTDEEIGALLLLPGFIATSQGGIAGMFSQFNEVGSMLQHVGGRGEVLNTDHGTLEITLHFPVPFTVMEAALVRTGATRFALPAQQIGHFEAYRPERVEAAGTDPATGKASGIVYYTCEDGKRAELLNWWGLGVPFEAENPMFVLVLDALGDQRCLVVDAVDGYERISVNQLPPLLDRKSLREAGCFGYAILKDGSPCAVVSIRHLLNAVLKEEADHA